MHLFSIIIENVTTLARGKKKEGKKEEKKIISPPSKSLIFASCKLRSSITSLNYITRIVFHIYVYSTAAQESLFIESIRGGLIHRSQRNFPRVFSRNYIVLSYKWFTSHYYYIESMYFIVERICYIFNYLIKWTQRSKVFRVRIATITARDEKLKPSRGLKLLVRFNKLRMYRHSELQKLSIRYRSRALAEGNGNSTVCLLKDHNEPLYSVYSFGP